MYMVSTTCLNVGFRERELSSHSPLTNDSLGPPAGLPSEKRKATSSEANELRWSTDWDLRKERSSDRVVPPEPAAIRLSTTWMESGEKTRLEPLESERSRLERDKATSVWELIASLTSMAASFLLR